MDLWDAGEALGNAGGTAFLLFLVLFLLLLLRSFDEVYACDAERFSGDFVPRQPLLFLRSRKYEAL